MLTRNEIDFHEPFNLPETKEILSLIELYIQHRKEIPAHLRLSTQEERLMLSHFPKQSPLLEQKLEQLEGNPVKGRSLLEPIADAHNWNQLTEHEICLLTTSPLYSITSNSETSSSLLRRQGLASKVSGYLDLIPPPSSTKETYQQLYAEVFRKKPSEELTLPQLSQAIEQALTFIAASRTQLEERKAAIILLAALQDPESFKNQPISCPNHWKNQKKFQNPPAKAIAKTLASLRLPMPYFLGENSFASEPAPAPLPLCPSSELQEFTPYVLSPPQGIIKQDGATLSTTYEQLEDLFDQGSTKDPSIRSHLSSLSDRMRRFSSEPRPSYSLEDEEAFLNWKNQTAASIDLLEREVEQERIELLFMANKPLANPLDQHIRTTRISSGYENPLYLQDLLLFFVRSDPAFLAQRNPALSCEEAEEILQKTHHFLIRATHLQHLKRLSQSFQLLSASSSPQETSLALEEIITIATMQRNYPTQKHPDYLVFELNMNLLLWKEQIINLEKLQQDGLALEMIMGGGKTSVLLPLHALKKADGQTLSLLVMPEALIPSMADTLRSTLLPLRKELEIIDIDRNTPLGRKELTRLYDRLSYAVTDRKIVVMSSSSLQSLLLHSVEAALKSNQGTKEIDLFQKIFLLMHKSGSLTMDEMDSLLDVLRAHQFTQGEKEPIHQDLLDAGAHIYHLLINDDDLKGMIQWNFLPDLPGLSPLTEESFKTLLPRLIDKLLDPKLAPDKESAKFLAGLNEKEKLLLISYLKGSPDLEAIDCYERIVSTRVKNLLAIWKEELTSVFLLTAKKRVDEHYGEDLDGKDLENPMAIPYHGAETPITGAQFGTDLEIENYTINQHLAKGVQLSTIQAEIKQIQEDVWKEIGGEAHLDIQNTPSYARFLRLTRGRRDLELFNMRPCDIDLILHHVNKTPSLRLELIRRHILPLLKTYPGSLKTNAHVFGALVPGKVGFSGTLGSARSYPNAFTHLEFSSTEEKTLKLLWDHQTPVAAIPHGASLQDQVEKIYTTHRGSLADLGGIFRGTSSEEVARTIMQLPFWKNTKIQGIVFYDSEGKRQILLKETLDIILFEQSGLSKEEIIAYWSQKYTTGSDIPLAADMTTTVTIGEHTAMRDLLQAVWRNRKLHRGQRISFNVLEEDEKLIREKLNKAGYQPQERLSLADVFFYVKYHEAQRQGDYNLRGLRFNIKNILIKHLLQKYWTTDNPQSFKKPLQEMFSEDKPKEPYLQYGSISETVSGEEIGHREIVQMKKTAAFQLFSYEEQKEIEGEWNEILNQTKPHLPNEAPSHLHYGTQTSVEMKAEQKKEQKTEEKTEQKTEMAAEFQTPNIWVSPRSIFLWKKPNLFTRKYFIPGSTWSLPPNSLVVPDFERVKLVGGRETLIGFDHSEENDCDPFAFKQFWGARPEHPRDHLDIEGPDLLADMGIRPLQFVEGEKDLLVTLNADPYEKIKTVLLIQDRETQKLKAVLLNPWDTLMFKRLLEQDRMTPQESPREVRLALYRFDLGFISQGSDPIDPSVEHTPEFIQLREKTKHFNEKTKPVWIQYKEQFYANILPVVLAITGGLISCFAVDFTLGKSVKALKSVRETKLNTLIPSPAIYPT